MVLFGGACVVLFGGHAWFYLGGAWFYSGGMRGFIRGACVVLFSGGHAWFYSGACMVLFSGGHAWFYSVGGVHGFIQRGACVVLFSGGRAWFFQFSGYNEIRSMSGRYASYWNAFLLNTAVSAQPLHCSVHSTKNKPPTKNKTSQHVFDKAAVSVCCLCTTSGSPMQPVGKKG